MCFSLCVCHSWELGDVTVEEGQGEEGEGADRVDTVEVDTAEVDLEVKM